MLISRGDDCVSVYAELDSASLPTLPKHARPSEVLHLLARDDTGNPATVSVHPDGSFSSSVNSATATIMASWRIEPLD